MSKEPEQQSATAGESDRWYQELCASIRSSLTKCCNAPVEDAGTCYEGCCDKWRCSKCGKTWLQELGD